MPLFLLYNAELVKGMLRPIFKFAKMPVWGYDFAPHDVGTYPHCSGQVYGLNVEKNQFHGNYAKDGGFQTHFPLYLLPNHFDAYIRFADNAVSVLDEKFDKPFLRDFFQCWIFD